jgi:hypothetical protein
MFRAGLFRRLLAPAVPPLNSVHLVGVVHDIQQGFVQEDPVTQFQLTCTLTARDDSAEPALQAASGSGIEKEHITVRCFGSSLAQDVRAAINDGCVVAVNGQLRTNPQPDPTASNRVFYFPFVQVNSARGGTVTVLHGKSAHRGVVTPSSQ